MKKILFILLLLPTTLFAQTSICGVDFGASYSTAERILENKFGDKSYLLSDKTSIVFTNKMYAGRLWNKLYFWFQSDGYKSYFSRCILINECKTASEAKSLRDAIKDQMQQKYFILEYTDEKSGFKYYLGGSDPTNDSLPGFSIDILKYDDGSYAVRIDYGPYNYVREEL